MNFTSQLQISPIRNILRHWPCTSLRHLSHFGRAFELHGAWRMCRTVCWLISTEMLKCSGIRKWKECIHVPPILLNWDCFHHARYITYMTYRIFKHHIIWQVWCAEIDPLIWPKLTHWSLVGSQAATPKTLGAKTSNMFELSYTIESSCLVFRRFMLCL